MKGRFDRSTDDDVALDDLGAEPLGLRAQLRHQVGPHDAVAIPGPVLDHRGQHQLTAGFDAFDDERLEIGARRVERGGESGRAGADDDDLLRGLSMAVFTGACRSICARRSFVSRPTTVSFEIAVLEEQQRRDAAHHELARRHRVFVDVHLRHRQLAVIFLGQLIDDRRDAPARRAPGRPEIHEHHAVLHCVAEIRVRKRLDLL